MNSKIKSDWKARFEVQISGGLQKNQWSLAAVSTIYRSLATTLFYYSEPPGLTNLSKKYERGLAVALFSTLGVKNKKNNFHIFQQKIGPKHFSEANFVTHATVSFTAPTRQSTSFYNKLQALFYRMCLYVWLSPFYGQNVPLALTTRRVAQNNKLIKSEISHFNIYEFKTMAVNNAGAVQTKQPLVSFNKPAKQMQNGKMESQVTELIENNANGILRQTVCCGEPTQAVWGEPSNPISGGAC